MTCSGTKQAAHRLKILFGLAGFKAAELHGNLTQVQRLDVSDFLLTCLTLESLNQDPQFALLYADRYSIFLCIGLGTLQETASWFSYCYWCGCSGVNSILILFLVLYIYNIVEKKISYINFTDMFLWQFMLLLKCCVGPGYYWCSNCYKLCMSSWSHQVDIGFCHHATIFTIIGITSLFALHGVFTFYFVLIHIYFVSFILVECLSFKSNKKYIHICLLICFSFRSNEYGFLIPFGSSASAYDL